MKVLPLLPIVLLLVHCSSGTVTNEAESNPGHILFPVGVTVPDGQLLVVNDPEVHFSVLIPGKEFRSIPTRSTPIAMVVDSTFVQVTTQSIREFYDADFSGLSDEQILTLHQNYEVDYLGGQIEEEYRIYQEPIALEDGRKCLLWTIDAPGIATQVLMSTVVGPRVLLIGSAFNRSNARQVERVVDKLIAAVKSVDVSDGPIDIAQIQRAVRKRERVTSGSD